MFFDKRIVVCIKILVTESISRGNEGKKSPGGWDIPGGVGVNRPYGCHVLCDCRRYINASHI